MTTRFTLTTSMVIALVTLYGTAMAAPKPSINMPGEKLFTFKGGGGSTTCSRTQEGIITCCTMGGEGRVLCDRQLDNHPAPKPGIGRAPTPTSAKR
jgi:hypothetical protein